MRNPHRPDCARHRAALLRCCLLLLALCLSPATAQELNLPDKPTADPDRFLTNQRWGELRYGLTIREPHDATRVADTREGDIMRWAMPNGTRIRLSFARGVYEGVAYERKTKERSVVRMPARVDLIKKRVDEELQLAVRGQVINLENNQVIEIGELAGILNYYAIKPEQHLGQPYLQGIAILQLDELSVAILRMECPPEQVQAATRTFECMLHSIQSESAKKVNERIHRWLTEGETLLSGLTQDDRLKAMQGDQLYRVLESGRDVGYLRVWQRYQDKAFYQQLKAKNKATGGTGGLTGLDRMKQPGNAVIIQSHFEGNGAKLDRLREAIDIADEVNELWQIKTTMRYENDPRNLRAGAWVETGVRGVAKITGQTMDHVQITREGTPPRHMVDYLLEREKDPSRKLRFPSADPRSVPSGDLVEKAWPTPKRAFLSMVDAELMPAMLPREAKTYAFAAYHPESSKIDIRWMRVEPTTDGGKRVYLRPVLDLSPQVLTYDRDNRLIKRTYPDGREMRRTTRQELAQVWGIRLRD